jgi:hypothetical protein
MRGQLYREVNSGLIENRVGKCSVKYQTIEPELQNSQRHWPFPAKAPPIGGPMADANAQTLGLFSKIRSWYRNEPGQEHTQRRFQGMCLVRGGEPSPLQ